MSPAIAYSKLERDRANKWVSETIGSRNVSSDITVTIIVMQRLHEMDTTGYLLKKEGLSIKHICIPAELSDDVKPEGLKDFYQDGLFDPERRSLTSLQTARAELGTYGYAGQMQQRPSPEEGGIIKRSWLQMVKRDPVTRYETNRIIHFQLDTAYTEKLSNDPTAIIAYYVENNRVYIQHVVSVWKEFPDLVRWLPQYIDSQGADSRSKIYVEPKSSGKSIVQQIRYNTKLNIIESEAPKDDKLSRVHSVSPKIEALRVCLHEGHYAESFIQQATSFPNAEHDDELDCMVAIIMRELMSQQVTNTINYFSF
jgi:predicted phage terminase large subunit-like protein